MPQRNIFHHLANSIQKNTSNHLPIQGAIFLHQPKKIQVEWLTVQSQTFSKPFPQTFCGPMPLTGAPGIWLMLSGYRLPTYMARHIISCQKIGPRQATEPCSVLWKKYVANVKLQRQRNEKESDKAFMYIYIYFPSDILFRYVLLHCCSLPCRDHRGLGSSCSAAAAKVWALARRVARSASACCLWEPASSSVSVHGPHGYGLLRKKAFPPLSGCTSCTGQMPSGDSTWHGKSPHQSITWVEFNHFPMEKLAISRSWWNHKPIQNPCWICLSWNIMAMKYCERTCTAAPEVLLSSALHPLMANCIRHHRVTA